MWVAQLGQSPYGMIAKAQTKLINSAIKVQELLTTRFMAKDIELWVCLCRYKP